MISRLISALRDLQIDLTDEDVADILWFALQVDQFSERGKPTQQQETISKSKNTSMVSNTSSSARINQSSDRGKSTQQSESTKSSLHLPTNWLEETPDVHAGHLFKTPAVSALPNPLDITRALRPLRRKILSRTEMLLDERATAHWIAEQRIWIPVSYPAPARWMDLALVVEESRSMPIWYQTISEIQQLLEQLGAFRDIRTWRLCVEEKKGIQLYIGFNWTRKQQARSPNELIDPNGQRLILLVSDCVSSSWTEGAIPHLLEEWGSKGPVAILNVLPHTMWSRSALSDAVEALLISPMPGSPNIQLDYEPLHYWVEKDKVKEWLRVPIVTLTARSFATWSKGISGSGEAMPGYLFKPTNSIKSTALEDEMVISRKARSPRTAEDLLRRFEATASPIARDLAGLLAAAPINLPIVRIIQRTMLPSADLDHIAEIFLGGLLEQLPQDDTVMNPDEFQYDFVNGVRELLIKAMPMSSSIQVLKEVSDFIEGHFHQSLDFRALLADPTTTNGPLFEQINALSRPFAYVAAKVLRLLGGDYIELADRLEGKNTEFSEVISSSPSDHTEERIVSAQNDTINQSITSSLDTPFVEQTTSPQIDIKTHIGVEHEHKGPGSMNLPWLERRLAVVVGVNAAPHTRSSALQQELHATNDAEQMSTVLRAQCGFELLQPALLGAEASSDNVKRALLVLADQLTEEDFLLFYFSGHGHLVRRDEQNDVYLVTHNFDEREAYADPDLHLSMRWLQKQLYQSTSAGKVLLILDCCYTGEIGRTASDPYLEELKGHLQDYFGPLKAQSGSSMKGLRLALTATGHMQLAHDKDDNGLMTGLLLPALRGEVDQVIDLNNHGYVPLSLLQNYLQREMPKIQNPSLAGDYAGKEYILAQYEQRAEELRKRQKPDHRPDIYLPFVHNPLFQPRPDELDGLAKLPKLLYGNEGEERSPSSNTRPRIVALAGMGGIGKTSLSIELALLCQKENRFPAGIFWMPASATDIAGWHHQLAALALHTNYLPPDDRPGQIENEERRAHHFCLYLAQHADTLLILDNVVKPELIQSVLPQIAGRDLQCTILYTSRDKNTPRGVLKYEVEELKEENALQLLLDTRQETLSAIKRGTTNSETEAARSICRSVSYLPLALEHLRALLEQDQEMEIAYLQEELLHQEALEVIEILDKAFLMSWNLLDNEQERQLFKLAARFPEGVPIPLWLLGLATGLGEDIHISPLGKAYRRLVRASMLETLSNGQVRLHPLLREFGHRLLERETQTNKTALLNEVGRRLVLEFANANQLEKRVLSTSYWTCLGQIREARNFLHQLNIPQSEIIKRTERWLDRESSELAHSIWWPERLPGLFYQQMYNQAIEEGTVVAGRPPAPWLRLEKPSGAEDPALLRVLIGHTDAIKCVAFSPDGQQTLTGSYDKTARLWNSEDGQLLLTLQGHTGSVNSVAFSPDGKRLCTASDDNTARIWDRTSGELLLILQGHTERVKSIMFSRDGNSILTGSSDKTARLWDSQSGKLLLRFTRHTTDIQCVAFSEQQPWIMAAGSDTVRIWDKQRGEVLFNLDSAIIKGSSLTFSPDGRQLVVASSEYTASIIDCEQQKEVTVLTGHTGRVNSAAISYDGRFVLTGSEDNTVRLWDSQSGEALLILANHISRVSAVAFSPDEHRILSGSADKTARIWEYDGEVLLAQMQSKKKASPAAALLNRAENPWSEIQRWEEGRTWISRAAFSKNGDRLVTGNSYDASARVWDSTNETLLLTLNGRTSGITSVAISADERRIFTGSRDRTARIWDGESGKQLLEWSSDYDATSAVFSPDGRHILTNMDTQAALWDSTSGTLLRLFNGHTDKVRCAVFSPDGKWILTGSYDRTARVWNSVTGECITTLNEHESSVMCALFTPNGQQIVTTDRNQNLRLWSRQSGKLLRTIPLDIDIIHTLAISDNSELIAVCDTYGRMLLLQGKEPEQGKAIGLYAAPYEIRAISWLKNNTFLLVDRERLNDKLHFYRLKLESFENV